MYWVITPEVNTESVVAALRASWLRGAGADARFCVASGMSASNDQSLHWLHGLNRSGQVANGRADLNSKLHSTTTAAPSDVPPPLVSVPSSNSATSGTHGHALESQSVQPASSTTATTSARSNAATVAREAAAAQRKRAADTRELTRLYNNFLRHKVFEMMRQMCRSLHTMPFTYAFMMDADTAVNRSNLERFVASLDPSEAVYTGLCKRRSTWAHAAQRGVGGGPGILLSRPLLEATCPKLEQCAPLRTMMDKLMFAGGDLMLAKCMEFLGHRCKMERELPYTRGAAASRRGGELTKGTSTLRLDDLFRRGPPWVYPPLIGGTILIATRRSAGGKAIEQYQRLANSGLPPTSVISFHRVRPSLRSDDFGKDPRCRVVAEYTRLESGPAHWTSRCLPNFLLLGTPKSGTTSLFNWILQHPDVRAPVRKELHFWAPVLTPEKNCVDRADCAAFTEHALAEKKGSGARWPLSKITAGRMLTSYLELFPRVDPRDFAITGEASPAYLYSPSAALFLESSLMSHARLLLLLRDPVERAFSEFKNKRDLMVKGAPKATAWVNGHRKFGAFVRALRESTSSCSAAELYAACEACSRYALAPGNAMGSGIAASAITRNTSARERCVTPPVVWQSWYHLFLPRLQMHQKRLLIEFSDDLFADANALMQRVSSFIGLSQFKYSTSIAYNTEKRRGAYISVASAAADKEQAAKKSAAAAEASVSRTTSGGHSSVKRISNEANASSAAAQRSSAAMADLAIISQLMTHSVDALQSVLADKHWLPPAEQLRRTLPPAWLEKYRVVPRS